MPTGTESSPALPETAPFSYTTLDGIVHEAKSPAEVFKNCPIFQGLPEDEAALLLDAYVEGRKEMATEQKTSEVTRSLKSATPRKGPKKAETNSLSAAGHKDTDLPKDSKRSVISAGEADSTAAEAGVVTAIATTERESRANKPTSPQIEALARPVVRAVVTVEASTLEKILQAQVPDPPIERSAAQEIPHAVEPPPAIELPPVILEPVGPYIEALRRAEGETTTLAEMPDNNTAVAQEAADDAAELAPDSVTALDLVNLRAEIAGLYTEADGEDAQVDPEEFQAAEASQTVAEIDAPTQDEHSYVAEMSLDEVLELQQQLIAVAEIEEFTEASAGLALLQEIEQLLEESATAEETAPLAGPVEFVPDAVISLRKPSAEDATADSTEPAAAIPPHEVAIQAQDQPLELSLAHVARLLKTEIAGGDDETGGQESLPPHAQGILEAVADLKAALAETDADAAATERLSPRVVAEMVRLLGALGYEQPQEILLAFVQQHGLQSLLEMMEYLCQLSHHENRKEFLHFPAAWQSVNSGTADDTDTQRRTSLAPALFQLLCGLLVFPGGFAGDVYTTAA